MKTKKFQIFLNERLGFVNQGLFVRANYVNLLLLPGGGDNQGQGGQAVPHVAAGGSYR
jgi:hypothetical protein